MFEHCRESGLLAASGQGGTEDGRIEEGKAGWKWSLKGLGHYA